MAKSKKKSSGTSASALSRELAQISANAQIQVQRIANEATERSFQYNSQEAATARAFNKQEADTTRAYNSKEAEIARQFNASEAQKARDWEERMSNTSHQREVADLKKAGLNPVLSANGGATSYTTSSASAQAASSNASSASPASAYAYDASSSIGQLASTMMQGRIGAYEADKSAAATRYAARQSAAATKAMAASNLAAAREAAAASKYAADKNYKSVKFQTVHSKSGSVAGILENFRKATTKDNTGIGTTMSNLWKKVDKKPETFFKNKDKQTFKNLNASGRNLVQSSLRKLGISENQKNQKIMYNAIFRDNAKAQKIVARWMITFNLKARHAASVWNRSGSGLW